MTAGVEEHYRGVPTLLLVHCSDYEVRTPSAYLRLVAELGDNLAQTLVFALSGSQGRRAGSSSP